MILIIDNYDSFVYTLAGYVERLGLSCDVQRNDKISVADILKKPPAAIIISPGPCTPADAGICINLIKAIGATTPILGVCLGHQAIADAYGGQTVRSDKPVHGKSDSVEHDGSSLFHNIPSPFQVGRYHSLCVDLEGASDIKVTASNADHDIMAMQHKTHPVFGVQFHPESVLTPNGLDIIRNFLNYARDWHLEKS